MPQSSPKMKRMLGLSGAAARSSKQDAPNTRQKIKTTRNLHVFTDNSPEIGNKGTVTIKYGVAVVMTLRGYELLFIRRHFCCGLRKGLAPPHIRSISSKQIRRTSLGLALGFFFLAWPTRAPTACCLPPFTSATIFGFAATI